MPLGGNSERNEEKKVGASMNLPSKGVGYAQKHVSPLRQGPFQKKSLGSTQPAMKRKAYDRERNQ